MKKMAILAVVMMFTGMFSFSHWSVKAAKTDVSDFSFLMSAIGFRQSEDSVVNADRAYVTEEDENGHLCSVQVLPFYKAAGFKYANTDEKVTVGDYMIMWYDGLFTYMVKCDTTLPFRQRVIEARKWCVDKLGGFSTVRHGFSYRYPRILCVQ